MASSFITFSVLFCRSSVTAAADYLCRWISQGAGVLEITQHSASCQRQSYDKQIWNYEMSSTNWCCQNILGEERFNAEVGTALSGGQGFPPRPWRLQKWNQ